MIPRGECAGTTSDEGVTRSTEFGGLWDGDSSLSDETESLEVELSEDEGDGCEAPAGGRYARLFHVLLLL